MIKLKTFALPSLLVLINAILPSQGIANPAFDPNSCTDGPIPSTPALVKLFEPGQSEKYIGRAATYKRTRTCDAVTGCGEWSQPTYYSTVDFRFVTVGRDIELNLDFETNLITLNWLSEPMSAAGQVNRGGWVTGINGDEYNSYDLFLREGCIRVVLYTRDLQTQYGLYKAY